MKQRIRGRQVSCLAVAALLLWASDAVAQRYVLTDLGVADPRHTRARAWAINNRGEIVGLSSGGRGNGGFLWTDGRMIPLPALATGLLSIPNDLNDKTICVGESGTNIFMSSPHATVWIDAQPHSIHQLGDNSHAFGINENNVIFGQWGTYLGRGGGGAFVWRDGQMTSLPSWSVRAINNHDQISGVLDGRALVWQRDLTPVYLEFLPEWERSTASRRGINDRGVVVGLAVYQDGRWFGAVWRGTRFVRLLPVPNPEFGSMADAINEHGEITVSAYLFSGGHGRTMFIWREGVMMNLNDLIVPPVYPDRSVWEANDINDHGQIAATTLGGGTKAVRLDPIDEGLTVWSITPCDAGTVNEIEIINATPGRLVHLVYGTLRAGQIPVPGCPGSFVELENARLYGTARADPDGTARFRAYIPPQAANKTFVLQAIDRAACEVSPPAWTLFREVR